MSANPSKSDGLKFWVQTFFLLIILVSVLCIWGQLQILWWFSCYSHSEGLNLLICYSWSCIMSWFIWLLYLLIFTRILQNCLHYASLQYQALSCNAFEITDKQHVLFMWVYCLSLFQIVDLDLPNTTESYRLYCMVCSFSFCYIRLSVFFMVPMMVLYYRELLLVTSRSLFAEFQTLLLMVYYCCNL